MMNKRIRSMIDDIFSDMKMTAENLALRDEMMANAQARYEDNMAQGKSEEEAFAEVAESLGDVSELLREMNGAQQTPADAEKQVKSEPCEKEAPKQATTAQQCGEEDDEQAQNDMDLGDALNKAFSALGGLGKSFMPQAKKLVRDVDEATGGAIKSFGRVLGDGVKNAQKAAGEAIDKMTGDSGEIVIDLGKPVEPRKSEKTAGQLREEAADLRAQAQIKLAVGDRESADEMNAQADALDRQADEREQAQNAAKAEAQDDSQEAEDAGCGETDYYGADGEINEDAFSKAVDDMTREAEEAIRQASDAVQSAAEAFAKTGEEVRKTVKGGSDVIVSGSTSFPVAGLRKVDIQLDADDVRIEPAQGNEIVVSWEGHGGDPDVRMENHVLIIRRKNPDMFKTFFSFFKKDGGEFAVKVPLGYAADYAVSTTSGDIRLSGVDADNVKLNTTSGDMRVEPDLAIRAQRVTTGTVSGDVTVSARCEDIAAEAVSGDLFVSCDAKKVSVNSVSGDVHVEGACDEWEIETVNSDVDLLCTVAPTKKMNISNINGDAHVALPGDIRGFVAEISSVSGHIENEFGPNRYGTCALPISMDTVNGDLLITRL